MENKLRVWWNPQVGACDEAFYVPVQNVEEAKKVMDILAAYDAYQLQNNIKPDYCNIGGLQMYNQETGEYEDWYLETEDDYFDNVDDYIESTDKAEEIEEFTRELYKQIDWDTLSGLN